MARTPVGQQMARTVKEMLWKGTPQERIAVLTGVSQSTISRIKQGKAHEALPWPDGTLGPMPSAPTPEEGWGAEASRYLALPTETQERILETVNKRRVLLELVEIPDVDPAYAKFLNEGEKDAIWEGEALIEARIREDDRMALIMLEFNAIVDEDLSVQRDKGLLDDIQGTRGVNPNPPPPIHVGPPAYQKIAWAEVLQRDPLNPIVKEAMILKDKVKIEAICIVFYPTKDTRGAWRSDSVRELIGEMERMLRTYPTLIKEIEG